MENRIMDWERHAAALADRVVHPTSRWRNPIAGTPRHAFMPRWWRYLPDEGGWTRRDGAADSTRWAAAAYADRTVVTRVGPLHADAAGPDDHPTGLPTSSATLPSLVVTMLRQAQITDGADTLCITGSGYTTALLCKRLGDTFVTSVDVDPYLVDTASERLTMLGHKPRMVTCDITGPLPGGFDRIVSTVGLPGIPSSWMISLRPGGRMVTNLAGTGLVIVADALKDGGARGRVTEDRAGFMATRSGTNYPPAPDTQHAWNDDGDDVTRGPYPVLNVGETWELRSMLALEVPGVRTAFQESPDGLKTAVLTHPDGSWARATGRHGEQPVVHQTGPQRLWDVLDGIRHRWLSDGALPVHGATAEVDPDGTLHLSRGPWSTSVPPATPATAL